jgi:glycosyltransferase involved in cell wall biosynthesis
MESKTPLVSIGIPTFNSGKYIAKTLESIAAQTFRNLEVIVIDNCSTDTTMEICQSFKDKFKNFRIIVNDHNIGGEANFNKAFQVASGDLIAIFHSDDVYHPDIVQKYVDTFLKDPKTSAISCMGKVINDAGNETGAFYHLPQDLKSYGPQYSFEQILRAVLINGNSFLICPSVMIKKSTYQQLGGFEFEKFRSSSDLGLWLKIAQAGSFTIVDEKLINYRIHDKQGSQFLLRETVNFPDIIRPIKYFMKSVGSKEIKKLYNYFLAFQILRTLRKRLARKKFNQGTQLLRIGMYYLIHAGIGAAPREIFKLWIIAFALTIDLIIFRGKISSNF